MKSAAIMPRDGGKIYRLDKAVDIMAIVKICKVSALKDGRCGASVERSRRIIAILAAVAANGNAANN